MSKARNINLDLMRFLGVLIIMLAHAEPPAWIHQLRNFGTPLLIVASALTYAIIYSNSEVATGSFLRKRLTRLTVPAWIFLTLFFSVTFVAADVLNKDYPFSAADIFETMTFYNGIGFVWIFKVYIMLALITPWAVKFSHSTLSNSRYFGSLLCLYMVYEAAIHSVSQLVPQQMTSFFNTTVFVVIPYSLLYLYGLRLGRLNDAQILRVVAVSLLVFLVLMFVLFLETGEWVGTQKFKYPPTLYYLSYSFVGLNLVYLFCRRFKLRDGVLSSWVVWLSANSLWIYLWHILAYFFWASFLAGFGGEYFGFILKGLFLLSFGIAVTYAQINIINHLCRVNTAINQRIKFLLT